MEKNLIFQSYRRQDVPGYVGRLADHLESAFGKKVFRDVDSIGAGTDWKKVLNKAVSEAQLVIAIIGRHWQKILEEKNNADADYIRFELNLARLLEKPIIPVKLQDSGFDSRREMGDLNWLKDLQFFELSDRQNRWENDVNELVRQIAELTDLKPLGEEKGGSNKDKTIEQTSQGDKSPNIVSSGDVNINYGDKD